ncbi:hypothetical protein G6F19_012227 [Rhizopus arrhizus]|nr:hypothetical protein G6F19_012227 [Rhizopus arrhizus]KAG0958503.1 hypothetical protein G6F31_012336 [Rhizopus arrhizus]
MTDENAYRQYTEEQLFSLFEQWSLQYRPQQDDDDTEFHLPVVIADILETTPASQLKESFRKFKKGLRKYRHEEWTTSEEINKQFIPKLKSTQWTPFKWSTPFTSTPRTLELWQEQSQNCMNKYNIYKHQPLSSIQWNWQKSSQNVGKQQRDWQSTDGHQLEPRTIKQQSLQQKLSKSLTTSQWTISQKKGLNDKHSVKNLSGNTTKFPIKTRSTEQQLTTNQLERTQDMEVVVENEEERGQELPTTPITTINTQTNNNSVISNGDNFTSTVQQSNRSSTLYSEQQLQYSFRRYPTRGKTEQILQQLDQSHFSQVAIISYTRGVQNSIEFEPDSMEIEEDESKIRGPDSSRPSSRKIYDCRKNRDFTQSKQRLSVQLLHHSGSYQEKTDSGLQNDQQLYPVPSFQDGGSACSSRGNRKERFHMQNRFERCLCGCATAPRLPQISYISTQEHCIPIQNSGFWNEYQSTDLQQNYALCYRTFEERGHTYDLIFRRHLFTSEIRRRNEDCQFQSVKTSGGSRVYYQFNEECINAVENTTVFRLPIQHQEDVNYCAARKDQQTDQEGETSSEGRLQLQLQVDSKSIGEDDFHVTSDSRRCHVLTCQ